MQRRTGPILVALATSLFAAACTGGDDSAASSTAAATMATATVESTVPPTDPPTTLPPETTSAPSTAAPTTTVDVEALKAQIAADYQRSWQLRLEITENPTLDGLDDKLAQIAVPDSVSYQGLRDAVTEMVAEGRRTARGVPDQFSITVESVELLGQPPFAEAVLTYCYVTNRVNLDAAGNVIPGSEGLYAARRRENVRATGNGWLPFGLVTPLWENVDVTVCPPA